MRNPFFKFKQFTIQQDKCAMKVGTDGVLLGAWAGSDGAKTILDIGTGTGLVSLMLAQRFSAKITAIEIDENAYQQATENVALSPWKERIELVHIDFNDFHPQLKYHLIVCNPPYFIDSLPSPDTLRTLARHNQKLTYNDLLKGGSSLLEDTGEFVLIVPAEVVENILSIAERFHLFPGRLLNIRTTPGKPIKRNLISLGFERKQCIAKELLIETERHKYSDEFTGLVKDFYLKM